MDEEDTRQRIDNLLGRAAGAIHGVHYYPAAAGRVRFIACFPGFHIEGAAIIHQEFYGKASAAAGSRDPRHWCEFDNGVNSMSPMSLLDCDQKKCAARADLAHRACYFSLDDIKSRLADAERAVNVAMDHVSLWKLVLEAKERQQ